MSLAPVACEFHRGPMDRCLLYVPPWIHRVTSQKEWGVTDALYRRSGPYDFELITDAAVTPRTWTPVRFVREEQSCCSCGRPIPRASPGAHTGERGTKAWYSPDARVWEHLACHERRTAAEIAA